MSESESGLIAYISKGQGRSWLLEIDYPADPMPEHFAFESKRRAEEYAVQRGVDEVVFLWNT